MLRSPYRPTTGRWCAAVDESSTPEVEHAVVTTVTLCGCEHRAGKADRLRVLVVPAEGDGLHDMPVSRLRRG